MAKSSIQDIYAFCYVNADNCSAATIMSNMSKNMFVFIGKFTEITEVMKDFPSVEVEEFHAQTLALGGDLGSMIRVVLAYESK